jgi:hypothetical protein
MNKMDFTAQELRQGKNHLLRRLQRKMDAEEQILPTPKIEESFLSKSFKSKSVDCFLEQPKEKKQTRLGLMKRRYDKF